MLRAQLLASKWFKRTIYVPRTSGTRGVNRPVNSRLAIAEAEREAALLDQQLNELKAKQRELRQRLSLSDEVKAQQKLVPSDLTKEASETDIRLLEKQLKQSASAKLQNSIPHQNSILDSIPSSIQGLLAKSEGQQEKGVQLFSLTWTAIIPSLPILNDVEPTDIENLMAHTPLKQRAQLVSEFERIIPHRARTQPIKDHFMACYAELARPQDVEKIFSECETPTIYSFAHLAKSYFKSGSPPETVIAVTRRMKEAQLTPNMPVMCTVIQSLIQFGRFSEANEVFDSMKYWSVHTQPDLKLYNTMILCFAKQYNINKCLDLLTEMRQRRPYPLEPNQETYNYLIYACSRDPKSHLMAWEFFMEAQSNGFAADRQSFRALMYLCGSTGEVLLARALVRKLAERSTMLMDDFTLNCLLNAYSRWHPGPSKILSSPAGQNIRANLLVSDFGGIGGNNDGAGADIPLLPTAQLNRAMIVAESNSVFEYFAETNYRALAVQNQASQSRFPALHNYLRIAINFSTLGEFKRRFHRFTKYAGEEEDLRLLPETPSAEEEKLYAAESRHPQYVVKRDQHLYQLAMRAAIVFKNIGFGREIWTERGNWRKLPEFRSRSSEERDRMDFHFARDLIELLAECGNVEEAIMVAESAQGLRKWKRYHLSALIRTCEKLEDTKSLARVLRLTYN